MIRLKKIFTTKISDLDPDLPETTIRNQEIIKSKKLLRDVYEDHYRFFLANSINLPDGIRLEVGSGAGFIKEVIPDILTSDIQNLPHVDKVFSALQLPFQNDAIGSIYMINVLHHLAHPKDFFREAERCLKPGGKILLVEPANTLWGRFIYQNFHHEPFIPKARSWDLPEGGGPMSAANGAIPWIVFVRDREIFEAEFPGLTIEQLFYCHPLRYILSGGLSRKQLIPDSLSFIIDILEDKILKPFTPYLGLFMRVVVTKIQL